MAALPELRAIQNEIKACRACPRMVGGPVHGAAVRSRVFLLGQAPGPREESYGKPFAYTAGRTLFHWFETAAGIDEDFFRDHVYMAAVARCFPGKAKSGGDRLPDREEIVNCRGHLAREIALLKPELILPVGKLAIAEVLGGSRFPPSAKLVDVIGKTFPVEFLGHSADAICLPHPSGLSAWHKIEPGKSLLRQALRKIVAHPAWRAQME